MSDKIKVRITANQRVYFDQVVEMERSDWERLKGEKPGAVADELGGGSWLDLRNISNANRVDEDDFEMIAVDENGKPVDPVDRYEG